MSAAEKLQERVDLRPETRAWLEATYGVQTPEPGQWLQTLTFVEDGVDNFVLEGDRRVFVNEPASGQKLEVGYFKDKTTVGELRHKLRMLLLHRGRARYANGCGFEAESGELQWIRGPLICGGVLLADDSRTLTSYEVKGGFQGEPSVIFSVGSVGEAIGAAVDPDLALEAVEQIKDISVHLDRLLRHQNRGPGGVSGNWEC